jgi:H/ACA ribonucleoprotein complex subunit 4
MAISGLIVLDKPAGLTSFDCVERVRKIFGVKKAGHTGTLDPKVTGVLLILLGEARKLAPFFEKMDKSYIGVMHLHKEVEVEKLTEVLQKFKGKIVQLPPRKSRVKRVPRKRKIYKLEIKKIEGKDVTLLVKCEHGTYIRKLFWDIGQELKVGAHMKYLRRIAVNGFEEKEAISLEKLEKEKEKYLISNENIISRLNIKKIVVGKEKEKKIRNGVPIFLRDKKLEIGERVAIFVENKLVAIGSVEKDKIKIDRVLLD